MYSISAISGTKLSRELQQVLLRVPAAHRSLRENPFLDPSTCMALLRTQGSQQGAMYLYKRPTRDRVRTLLRVTPELDVSDRVRSDMDLAAAEWMLEHRLDARTLRLARRSGLPNVANALLRHPDASLEDRLAVAAAAYRADRLVWLASSEADGLSDEEVWELAECPDTLEECCEGTMLDNQLRRREVTYGAQLLHVRPSLQERAVALGTPQWLVSAASVKLDTRLQLQLVAQARGLDPAEEKKLGSNLGRGYGEHIVDAVSTLVSTPWCADEVRDLLIAEPARRVRVREDLQAYLRVDRDYSYRDGSVVHDLSYRPACDLLTAPPEVVESWLDHAEWSDALSAPYVALDLLKRRDLSPRLRRQRRRALKAQARAVPQVLARTPRWQQFAGSAECTRYGSPDVVTPYTPPAAGPDVPLYDARFFGDGGLLHLASTLSEEELVVALTLLLEGAEGTVGELALTASGVLAQNDTPST